MQAFFMYRMYGMSQGAKDGGAAMYRMYGMSQGARDGGAAMYGVYRMLISSCFYCRGTEEDFLYLSGL